MEFLEDVQHLLLDRPQPVKHTNYDKVLCDGVGEKRHLVRRFSHYRIVLIFRGSLISRIWNRLRNLFNENLSHCAVTPMGHTNSRNLFNEFLQSSYSRKFRPAKYKHYTI